jgi:hypothetical protein
MIKQLPKKGGGYVHSGLTPCTCTCEGDEYLCPLTVSQLVTFKIMSRLKGCIGLHRNNLTKIRKKWRPVALPLHVSKRNTFHFLKKRTNHKPVT